MTVIELPDEQAAALEARAAAEGLSLVEWIQQPAEQAQPASRPQACHAGGFSPLSNRRD